MDEDDTFARLRAMSFDEALSLAIRLYEEYPLGTSGAIRLEAVNYELKRFGWSYEKLATQSKERLGKK